MPSTAVSLTWAVPVSIIELGSHLELFRTVVPGIRMLRLCNRLGQGPEAHITKLPVELVHQIEEEYILRVMRVTPRKVMEKWETDYNCWTSDCAIGEHFDDDRMVEICNDEMSDKFAAAGVCPCGCGISYDEHLREETCADPEPREEDCHLWATHVSGAVEDLVYDLAMGKNSIADEYEECCQERKDSWVSRTTRASDDRYGRLDRIETLLKAHFGLEIWVNHLKVSKTVGAHTIPDLSTKAFIVLPSSSTPSAQPESVEQCSGRVGSDISFPFDTTIPVLSKQSAARFARTKRLLRLTGPHKKPALRLLVKNREEN